MWRACGLPLLGPCLRPVPGILRLGACSLWPLIQILGPNFSQAFDMILSSAAMVASWPDDACVISTVCLVTFIFPFIIAGPLAWAFVQLCHSGP